MGKRRVPLASDRKAAQRMLDELIRRAERGQAGIPEDGRTELEPLIAEWGISVGRDAGESHVAEVVRNVRRVLSRAGVLTLADLRARGVAERIEIVIHATATGPAKLSRRTAATYGMHARQFTRWLWLKKQIFDADPLAGLTLPDQSPESPRRDLSPAELARLVEAARVSPRSFRGLTGPDRAALYLTAAATGFRVLELSRLTSRSFTFGGSPRANLRPTDTKNREAAEQPLPPSVAVVLASFCEGRAGPLWPGSWTERAFKMIRLDLSEAGIEPTNARGSIVFHSLRHTYTSMLASVAPVAVVQGLARHASSQTTLDTYTHTTDAQRRAAVDAMPLPGANTVQTELSPEQFAGLVVVLWGMLCTVLAPPLAPPAAESDANDCAQLDNGENRH